MKQIEYIPQISLVPPSPLGPLRTGVYVQIGMGLGFYVPQESFDECKRQANQTRRIQFLTIDKDGEPFTGTREECQIKGVGCIAWITPD